MLFAAALVTVLISTSRPLHAANLPDLANTPAELVAANVATSLADGIGLLAGPALAGAAMAVGGPELAFGAAGLVLATGAVVLATPAGVGLPGMRGQAPTASALWGLLRRSPSLTVLLGLGASRYLVSGAVDVLVVVLAIELLGWGAAGAGVLTATIGIGTLAGAAYASSLVGREHLSNAVLGGSLAGGTALAITGVLPLTAPGTIAVSDAGYTFADVAARTLMQRLAKGPVLAPVFGVLEGAEMAMLAVGALTASALVEAVGVNTSFVVAGAALPVTAFLLLARLRAADREARVPVHELALLRGQRLFQSLPPPTLESLALQLEMHHIPAGTAVVQQGERGDSVYLIASGEVLVTADGRRIAVLGAGDIFGEIALLRNVTRTATVITTAASHLYSLGREPFLTALGAQAELWAAAEALAGERLDQLDPDQRP